MWGHLGGTLQGTRVFSRRQVSLLKAWYEAVPQGVRPGSVEGKGVLY